MIQDEYGLWKEEYFSYNGKQYGVGTEFLFTGLCYLRGSTVFLKNERCKFKYICPGDSAVFDVNGEVAWCSIRVFENSICFEDEMETSAPQEELYLSDKSFYKLLWYIIIMVVGVIFYDRWLIWIGATIVFVTTTPEVKQFLKGGK
jgi:hypothetical protein